MSVLEIIRKINRNLHLSLKEKIDFQDLSELLSNSVEANAFILSRKGNALGFSMIETIENERLEKILNEKRFPVSYNNALLSLDEALDNVDIKDELSAFPNESQKFIKEGWTTIVPIFSGTERLGTLLLSRMNRKFNIDDLILAEYCSTVIATEISRARQIELENETRERAMVQLAIGSLSFSEIEAVDNIFEELGDKEGILVASKIADKVGITRSVIVNAMRKLESAGVIQTRSLGMKGTFIKIINPYLLKEIENKK